MSNLFERDFYPTPKEVISRMMMGEDAAGLATSRQIENPKKSVIILN